MMKSNANRRLGVPTRNIFNRPEKTPRAAFSMTWNQAAMRWRSDTFQTVKRMLEEENWPKYEGVAVLSIDILVSRFRKITRSRAASVVAVLQKNGRTLSRGYNERLGATIYVVSPAGIAYYERIEEVMRTSPPGAAPLPSVQRKSLTAQERWVKLEATRRAARDKAKRDGEAQKQEPRDELGSSLWMQSHRPVSMPSRVKLRDHALRNNLPWLLSRIAWQRSTHREPDSVAAWNSVSRMLGIRTEDLKNVWESNQKTTKK